MDEEWLGKNTCDPILMNNIHKYFHSLPSDDDICINSKRRKKTNLIPQSSITHSSRRHHIVIFFPTQHTQNVKPTEQKKSDNQHDEFIH